MRIKNMATDNKYKIFMINKYLKNTIINKIWHLSYYTKTGYFNVFDFKIIITYFYFTRLIIFFKYQSSSSQKKNEKLFIKKSWQL